MKHVAAALLLFFSACASAPKNQNSDDFRARLAAQNYALGQELDRDPGFKYLDFKLPDYYLKLQKKNPDLVHEIQSFDDVVLGVSPHTFAVCMKSIQRKITICDNSSTAYIDGLKQTSDLDLKTTIEHYRGN